MNILLNPIGSRGDIQPMIALGQYLQERGHTVRVAGSPNGATLAKCYGLAFYGIGFNIQKELENQKESIDNPIRVYRMFKTLIKQAIHDQFAELTPHIEWADVVLAGGVTLATYSLCEAKGKAFRYIAYCPQLVPSNDHPVIFFPFVRLPKWINHCIWRTGIRLLRSGLREHFLLSRNKLGLETTSSIEKYIFPDTKIIYAIDECIVPLAADLQPAVSTGYLYLPQPRALPEKLLSFIEAGDPPFYIGFGSMTDQAPLQTTRIILQAAKEVGVRVIIGRGWAKLGMQNMPPFAYLVDTVSHESLFPRMAGIVHHGGAGTTAAAARAGRPQAIIPHLLDQFYWADRIERLQVGPKGFWKRRLTIQKMATLFEEFTSGDYETKAQEIGGRLQRRNGLLEAATYIEKMFPSSSS
ncbi:MAG: nucleotide disphospho-sugar-binding domain-containing protein [Myxococcota bacterium]|nr:nucleotide disphospho-sugar-binding domain-containing protein [Myxococcota bacterium]